MHTHHHRTKDPQRRRFQQRGIGWRARLCRGQKRLLSLANSSVMTNKDRINFGVPRQVQSDKSFTIVTFHLINHGLGVFDHFVIVSLSSSIFALFPILFLPFSSSTPGIWPSSLIGLSFGSKSSLLVVVIISCHDSMTSCVDKSPWHGCSARAIMCVLTTCTMYERNRSRWEVVFENNHELIVSFGHHCSHVSRVWDLPDEVVFNCSVARSTRRRTTKSCSSILFGKCIRHGRSWSFSQWSRLVILSESIHIVANNNKEKVWDLQHFQQVAKAQFFSRRAPIAAVNCSRKTVVAAAFAGGVRQTLYLFPFSASKPKHSFSLAGHP